MQDKGSVLVTQAVDSQDKGSAVLRGRPAVGLLARCRSVVHDIVSLRRRIRPTAQPGPRGLAHCCTRQLLSPIAAAGHSMYGRPHRHPGRATARKHGAARVGWRRRATTGAAKATNSGVGVPCGIRTAHTPVHDIFPLRRRRPWAVAPASLPPSPPLFTRPRGRVRAPLLLRTATADATRCRGQLGGRRRRPPLLQLFHLWQAPEADRARATCRRLFPR